MKRKICFNLTIILLITVTILLPYIPAKAVGTTLSTEKSLHSFGTISYGEVTGYKAVTIFNNTDQDVTIGWEKADSDNMLIVDAPATLSIIAGGYTNFYVTTNDSLDPGKHVSSLYVYDVNDNTHNNLLKIDFSITVLLDAPYVTDIQISPATGNVTASGELQFQAKVTSHNNASEKVYFDVTGGYSNMTSIDSQGLLTVGADETAPLLKVTATSQIDSSVYTSALISVTADGYTISPYASNLYGGNVTYSTTTDIDSSIVLTAYPYENYSFKGWSLGGDIVSMNCQLLVSDISDSLMYKAIFEPMAYNINVQRNHPNGGAVSSSSTAANGSHISVLAIPNDGYIFDGWYKDNELISEESSYPIDYVNSDLNLLAYFSPREIDVQGSVFPSNAGSVDGLGQVSKSSNMTLTASANEGYEFAYYMINGDIVSYDPEYTIYHPQSDIYVRACFKEIDKETYTILAGTTTSKGRISYAGDLEVSEGNTILYTISPVSGYVISDVCVDGYSIGAVSSYSFKNLSEDHMIIASFSKAPAATIPMTTAHTDSINKIVDAYNSMNIEHTPITSNVNGTNVLNIEQLEELLPDYTFENRYITLPYDMDEMNGLLGVMSLSPQDARGMVNSGNKNILLSQAETSGFLSIYMYNEMGNRIGSKITNTYMPHLHEIAYNYLTDDDITALISGSKVNIGIYILNASSTLNSEDKELIDSYKMGGIKIDDNCYFEMMVVKNVSGYMDAYRYIPHPVTVTIDIPDDLIQEGRSYYILSVMRDANGEPILSCITDEDDAVDTITFTSSSLSTYALAYADDPALANSLTSSPYTMIIIALCIFSVVGASLYIIISGINSKKKRLR